MSFIKDFYREGTAFTPDRYNLLMTGIDFYDLLRAKIRGMTREQKIYKVLKEELTAKGYWKNKSRGKPAKGMEVALSTRFKKGL